MSMDPRTRMMCGHVARTLVRPGKLRVVCATGWRQKLWGLLGRRRLHPRAGLWLRPCRAVHTFGMRLTLTVVFLDRSDHITKIVHHLRPNRLVLCWRAWSVVEFSGADRKTTCNSRGVA